MKKGISLIVLIITIIVTLILAGAVILSVVQNNPIGQANEATFKADLDSVKSDYSMYIASQYAANKAYNQNKLNANELSAEYNGVNLPGKTIKDVIPVLATTDKYNGQFEVVNGQLIYLGIDRTKKRWAQDLSVEVIDADRLDAVITSTIALPVSAGTDVVTTIKYSSNASIDTINLENKLELLDENNVAVAKQPVFEIGTLSGDSSDTLRSVDIIIKTYTLEEGSYRLKLKSGSVYNIYDVTITKEIITDVLFEIDNTPPENPAMSVDPNGWTNGDVTVSIVYPLDSSVSKYSLDGTIWLTYTTPIVVTENNVTVYAMAEDISGNQSGQSTITIANIDKESPTVEYAPNGGSNLQTLSTKVTVTDVGVSNIKSDSLQYVWDTQNTEESATGWVTFANGSTIERIGDNAYYLWIKALDNAGNIVISKSNSFIGDNTPPENPTMSATPTGWTNGNVTVTIIYPSDANVKEYSTDGTIWSNYTIPVVVSVNNTTVYARATDASGNQSGQSTLTVANIDKELPTVTLSPNTTSLTKNDVLVEVSALDNGGSNIKRWRYRLSSDNGATYGTWQGVSTGFDPTKTYTLPGGVNVPVLSGPPMNLTQNQKYMIEFDYKIASGSSLFNVDLYPDDLPEIHPTATTIEQHYVWDNVTANSTNMNVARLRLFNDIVRPNPSDIYISNINLYPKGKHNILLNSSGDWKIQIEATDNAGNTNIINSNSYYIDKIAPTNPIISASPTTWTNGNVTVTITYPGDAATKEYSFDGTTWNIYSTPIAVTTNNTTVYARAFDASGNQSGQSTVTVANIDKTAPSTIATYKKADGTSYVSDSWTNQSVTITAAGNDGTGSGINKYQITYDGATYYDLPNGTVTLNTTGRTGVWVRAIDNVGNVGPNSATYLVAIDKWAPIVSYGTNGATNVQLASTTVSITDEAGLSGVNTSTLQYVWDVQNTSTPATGWASFTNGATITKGSVTGTYYLWIKAIDNAGNLLVSKSNAFTIVSSYAFNYTGNYQTWVAPITGKIKLETWGAMGSNPMGDISYSGKGGYASGELNITSGETLYIYVGGYGATGGWNGGAKNRDDINNYNNLTGGGASDIRRSGQSLSNRIIVAGGGGAGGGNGAKGGAGGGLNGENGTNILRPDRSVTSGTGGTQTSGGAGGSGYQYNGVSGTLGQGGSSAYVGGSGGGGYYGGGGGSGWSADDGGGGGGSSYIGGVLNGTTSTGLNTDYNGKVSITYVTP